MDTNTVPLKITSLQQQKIIPYFNVLSAAPFIGVKNGKNTNKCNTSRRGKSCAS